MGAVHIAVVADTHLRAGCDLPDLVLAEVDRADVVLHAGDILEQDVLDELGRRAPVVAVRGNNDRTLDVLPAEQQVDLGGVRIALVHDSGPRVGRARRMRRRFPEADLVVFGHSHVPVDEEGMQGQHLFNPGSPTQRRRQPHRTMGVLVVDDGGILEHRIVIVDPR